MVQPQLTGYPVSCGWTICPTIFGWTFGSAIAFWLVYFGGPSAAHRSLAGPLGQLKIIGWPKAANIQFYYLRFEKPYTTAPRLRGYTWALSALISSLVILYHHIVVVPQDGHRPVRGCGSHMMTFCEPTCLVKKLKVLSPIFKTFKYICESWLIGILVHF